MRGETWTAVREAFAAAVDAPAGEREASLATLPPEVRAEVESLLEAHFAAADFLESRDPGLSAGSSVGAYRLLEKIGEGGMGVVYRAERSDGEFRREVAIKLIAGRHFAPDAERRFIFERQILARLNHPHIVRMLDAGIACGRRYLVMELVAGEPLTAYCASRNLSTTARLGLFRDICDAIGHAHQNLVIHRDLKPSNILVTAEGEIKVLDFGVAQLAMAGDSAAPATGVLLRPMTLAYASPEQARGEPVTVASDIYSLGVLLYELLAGKNPHATAGLPLDAALQRICRDEPPRLPRAVAGDLDAIARKAMAKDPRARYGSASELLADIDRYLGDRPVLAQRPTLQYSSRKFVRRNPWLSAVSAGLTLSLLAGLAAFLWQHHVAEQERALAQSRFSQARRLIYTVIFDIQPKLETLPGATALRATLINSTLSYLREMEKNAGADPAFLRELINSYAELGRVQGDMAAANVGDSAASGSLDRGAALLHRLLALDPRGPQSLATAVYLYRQISGQRLQRGSASEAQDFARKAVAAARQLVGLQPTDENRGTLANALFAEAGATDSQDSFSQALTIYRSLLERKPGDPTLLRNCALAYKNIASLYFERDQPAGLVEARKALDLDRQLLAGNASDQRAMLDVAIDLSQMSSGYEAAGDARQAMAYASQSVELRQKILDSNPDDVRALDRLAWATGMLAFYQAERDLAGAQAGLLRSESLFRRLRARASLPNPSIARFARVELLLGELAQQQGQVTAGCVHLRESVKLYRQWKYSDGNSDGRFQEKALRESAACEGR